ncbi:4254_t:CDS:2, partial [Entrophospora sp. SA101]
NLNIKGVELAQEYGISVQSVSDILRQSSQWLNYDESSIPEINIFDAINFVSNAWDQITVETIKSSWKKTKIINNQSSTDLIAEEDPNQQSEINEINDLINILHPTNPLEANESITIDQNL